MAKRVFTQTFGVAGAIIEKEGKILLVKELEEKAKNLWNHPAGWIEIGNNPIEVVKKEVKEETGFNFEPQCIIGIYSLFKTNLKEKFGIMPHGIKIIFSGEISQESEGHLTEEIAETQWFKPDEIYQMDIQTLRDMDIKIIIRDYFEGKRYPLDLITHTKQ
jgi:8-oxo-dGTP pyrophosphatase MutT (NUDIX family)